MNELIREASASELEVYKFNDMADYDIDVSPGFVWEELQMFNVDLFDEKLQMEANLDKKYFTVQMNDAETDKIDFKVKVKFFALTPRGEEDCDNDEPIRLRMKFIKKQGDLQKWYDVLNEMKENVLNDILMTPQSYENQKLEIEDLDDSTKSE